MDDRTSSPRASPRVLGWVGAWSVLALGALATAATMAAGNDLAPQLILVLVVLVSELTEFPVRLGGRLTSSFTLIEAGVTATLLLLPGPEAVVACGLGALLANAVHRRPLLKLGFNTAQVTVSTAVAAWVLGQAPQVGPAVGDHALVGISLAMTAYTLLNMGALLGLMTAAGTPIRPVVARQGWFSLTALLGDLPIGVLAVELLLTRPELVFLLVAPAAAVYLAQQGMSRTQQLLTEIRREHDRLEQVVGGTSDGILLLDRDGAVVLGNAAVSTLTGIPQDRVVGSHVGDVLWSDPSEQPWQFPEATPDTPRIVRESRIRHVVDGVDRVVRESHTFRFEEGVVVGDVVVLTDVTREAEVAALKSDFVARVSHELRTPLTPIKGFAQVLACRGDELDPDQRQMAVDRILDSADRLASLVEDLLRVTELEGPTPDAGIMTSAVDLHPVLRRAVEAVHRRHPGRLVRVTGSGSWPRALADAEALEQALVHVVDNAVRYSPAVTEVSIMATVRGQHLDVAVMDRGAGIPSGDREIIFEPFHRLDDPLRMTTSGVGVGLFVARRLVRAMGGDLTCASRVGQGSTFHMVLPLVAHQDDRRLQAENESKPLPSTR